MALFCLPLDSIALALDQQDPDADFVVETLRRGRVLHEKGNYQDALKEYDKALDSGLLKGENQVIALNNRANLFADLGRFEEAVADYTTALEQSPAFAEAYYNRGIARYSLGEYLGAIDDFTRVMELDPAYVSAYYNRSFPLEGLGRFNEAIRDVGKALMMRPENQAYKSRLAKLQEMAREVSGD